MDTSQQTPTVEDAVADLREKAEAIRDAAMAEFREASDKASDQVSWYWDSVERLAEVRDEINTLRADQARLPQEAYTADMRGDSALEMELRGRFAEVERRLPEALAEERELAAALDSWLSGAGRLDPDEGAEMVAYGAPTGVLKRGREQLERLQNELDDVLSEIIEPVVKEHDELRGLQADRSHKLNETFVHSGSPSQAKLPPH